MIPKECKRLAEVDFPIAEVSRHAAREKSIRHGHPSTLHLWWARRPLASSRAVLMALLLPDPCDPHCPKEFKTRAKELLLAMRGRPSGWNSTVKTDEGLRQVLLRFIADFANWDNAAKTEYLETGRGLVQAAHPEQTPLVVDPFAGGGSILGLGVHPGDALLEAAAGADVSVDLCHAPEFTLMQRLPQHGNDSLFALFHTPRFWNTITERTAGIPRPDEPHEHAPSYLRLRPGQQVRRRCQEPGHAAAPAGPPRHTRGPDFHRHDQRPHHESPGLAGADGPCPTRRHHRRRVPGPVQPQL